MNQILATPLRRALGLHRSASAVRTFWEFGIPDMETIRLRCFLQSLSRAVRSSYSGNFLPSILATDISQHQPVASPHYCRSLTQEFSEINQQYPYKFKAKEAAGVKFAQPVVGKDAAKIEQQRVTMRVPFVPDAAGQRTVSGQFAFSVCTEETCLIEKRDLALVVDVK